MNIEKLINSLLMYYMSVMNEQPIKNLEVSVVSDMVKSSLQYAVNKQETFEINKVTDFIEGLNGRYIVPNKNRKKHIILIHEKQFNENYSMVHTIFHELTHVYDFSKFCFNENCNDFDSLIENELYNSFYYWSEFNAKRVAYKLYRDFMQIVFDEQYTIDNIIEFISTEEIPFQEDYFITRIEEYSNEMIYNNLIYCVMQQYGRYAVWEEYDSNLFNKSTLIPHRLEETLGVKIYDVYDLLKTMKDYNTASEKFRELDLLLNEVYLESH